jgi:tape measure domain-containing protein
MSAEFGVSLTDEMSGPARGMRDELKSLRGGIDDVDAELKKLDQDMKIASFEKMKEGPAKAAAELRLWKAAIQENVAALKKQQGAIKETAAAETKAAATVAQANAVAAKARKAGMVDAHAAAERIALDALGLGGPEGPAAAGASGAAGGLSGMLSGLKAAGPQIGAIAAGATAVLGVLSQIASIIGVVASKVADLTMAFSKAVLGAVAFREATRGALTTLLKGDAGAAAGVMQAGMKLALRFNLDPHETLQQMHELISKNFKPGEAETIITAMADLKVIAPKANTDAIVLAMSQIKSKGKLQMEELQGQLAEAGLNIDLVLQQLATKLHKSKDQIRKEISAGKISGDMGIEAIVGAVQEMGGGKLGAVAERAGKSIAGMWSGLQMRPGVFAMKVAEAVEGGGGVSAVKAALSTLLAVTDPTKSPAMKNLLGAAGDFANTLFSVLFGPASGAGAESGLQKAITVLADGLRTVRGIVATVGPPFMAMLSGLGQGFSEIYGEVRKVAGPLLKAFGLETAKGATSMADTFRTIGRVLAYVTVGFVVLASIASAAIGAVVGVLVSILGIVTAIFGAFVAAGVGAVALIVATMAGVVAAFYDAGSSALSAVGTIWTALSSLATAGLEAGSNLVNGLVEGIRAGIGAVVGAVTDLMGAAKTAANTAIDAHSPSRVFMQLGGYTAQGFAMGVDQGAPVAADAMAGMVAPDAIVGSGGGSGSAGAAGKPARGGGLFAPTFNFNGGSAETAGGQGDFLRDLTDAVERVAGEWGYSLAPDGS